MTSQYAFPSDIPALKSKVLKAITPVTHPLRSTPGHTKQAQRTNAGSTLPEYYLCYFLLVDLLGFPDRGKYEKVSWSVPIDYNGELFYIEHRKMGLGIFAEDPITQDTAAQGIAMRIKQGVKVARPYFEWRAQEAAKVSQLNVSNHHKRLFDKLNYFVKLYKDKCVEVTERQDERIVKRRGCSTEVSFPQFQLMRNAEWLALAALESFFSWTEHVFIHMAIINCKIRTGVEVADLAASEWSHKYKSALDCSDATTKQFYDELIVVRRQMRNYMAHGAFGKRGEAFSFHSKAGAVPLLLPHQRGNNRFTFYGDLGFDEAAVINLIESFIKYISSGKRKRAYIYIDSGLPSILTMTHDGSYNSAMKSVVTMKQFANNLNMAFDRAADMDW